MPGGAHTAVLHRFNNKKPPQGGPIGPPCGFVWADFGCPFPAGLRGHLHKKAARRKRQAVGCVGGNMLVEWQDVPGGTVGRGLDPAVSTTRQAEVVRVARPLRPLRGQLP